MAATLQKPQAGRTYISRRENLMLVLVRDRKERDALTGEAVETVQGKRLEFREGRLVVPEKGYVRGARGERISVKEVMTYLEGSGEPGDEGYREPHDLLGDKEEGFFALPKVAPPMSEEEAQAVVDLAIAGDVEGLEQMHGEEIEGWERKDLLELISETVEKVRAATPVAAG